MGIFCLKNLYIFIKNNDGVAVLRYTIVSVASPGFGRGGARIFFSDLEICMSRGDICCAWLENFMIDAFW